MAEIKRMSLDGKNADYIMGIDLGTTNSAVAIFNTGLVPTLVPMNAKGKTTLPSCVRWDGGKKFTVGDEAYAERYLPNVCYSIKRLMGSGKTFKFVADYGDTGYTLEMTPAEISAEILKALAKHVEDSFGKLTRCVITVPAYFNQRQIEDTVEASKLAGLECLQILKEPTSAAYIYSNLGYAQDGSVLIYDLGGGTFDITHMSFLRKANIPSKMLTALRRMYKIDLTAEKSVDDSSLYYSRVIGTYGDMWLGGDDIDAELAKIVVKKSGTKLSGSDEELLKLRCEQFKKSGLEAQDIMVGNHSLHVTKSDLEAATRVVFKKTMAVVEQIPAEELAHIKTVVLVGGSTKSEFLLEMLEEQFPGKEISRVLDPDATVALGAGSVAKDLYDGKATMYQDVLPMAIGVLSDESTVDVCIAKNTPMPHSVSKVYHTMYDNQEALSVEIYQGVSANPNECTHLGKLRVTGLPKKPAGELNVTIYFMLSAQGRLTVSTMVDGIMEAHELTIDSIYNVAKEDGSGTGVLGALQDDFEEAIADLCEGNEELTKMVMERRKAVASGDINLAAELEARIVEVL